MHSLSFTAGHAASPVNKDDATENLLDFTRYTFYGFEESWHHEVMADFLTRFADGKIPRGMIFMPPRHSKSEFVSRRLPAYIFGRNTHAKIIAASYTADLASMMSRDVQRIIDSPQYHAVFSKTSLDGVVTSMFFEINGGEGYYRAAGVNGGVSGMGASYGIIDDPIKDAAEAMSQTYRDSVWEWYKSTFYTRLEMPGSVLLTMTRWHEDDLAGRLLKQAKEDPTADQWEVLELEALASKDEPFRKKDEALWPDRYPVSRLKSIKVTVGDWWEPLYQQKTGKKGGNIFRREWFDVLDVMPSPSPTMRFCRFWDIAGTEPKTRQQQAEANWTVGTLVCEVSPLGPWIVVDVQRDRLDAGDVDKLILTTAAIDRARFGYVKIREEEEPGSSGKAVIAARRLLLAGYDYDGVRSTGEKSLRWQPLAAQSKGRNVKVMSGSWNHEWFDEMTHVPKSRFDDQADSASGAFNELTLGARGGFVPVTGY